MNGLARHGLVRKRVQKASNTRQIVEISHYEVETDTGLSEAEFKDLVDAIEHAVNLLLAGDCKRAKVKATITIETVEK